MVDLTGQVFGRWTVLSYAGKTSNRTSRWNCICLCGTEKVVLGQGLRSTMSRSCGCLVRDTNILRNSLPKGEALLRKQLRIYKQSAKENNRSFELPEAYFRVLLKSRCFYCMAANANGVDRCDNSQGYTETNSRPCCKICNYAKNTMSEAEFKDWVRRVYRTLFENL